MAVVLLFIMLLARVGCTPLHRAASTGNSELCELLIEEGAEVDAIDKAGQTPLMSAVICENKELCSADSGNTDSSHASGAVVPIWDEVLFELY
ncbi:hypothetical protein CsSME_00043537 [Camellia sinensis var. sinensis]